MEPRIQYAKTSGGSRGTNRPPDTTGSLGRPLTNHIVRRSRAFMVAAAWTVGLTLACGANTTPGGLLAVNANTGKEIWRADAPTAGLGAPAAGGRLVFVAGGNGCNSDEGTLAAFDATTGQLRWKAPYSEGRCAPRRPVSGGPGRDRR